MGDYVEPKYVLRQPELDRLLEKARAEALEEAAMVAEGATPSPVATQVEVTPCDVTHTKRWGWWCYAHNKPAYKSHDGLYYCNPDSPSPVATRGEQTGLKDKS